MENTEKMYKKQKIPQFNFNYLKISVILSIFAQPFEVMRTSSIVSQFNQRSINISGLIDLFKHIKQKEGFRGFYRGSILAILKNTSSYILFFSGLENLQTLKPNRQSDDISGLLQDNAVNFINASLSKLVSTTITSPINVLKTRFETVGMNDYKSILHAVQLIYQSEGFKGFYRGILASLLRDVPFSGIQYSIYQNMLTTYKCIYKSEENLNKFVFVAGSISSVIAILAIYPFDNMRVRFQSNTGQNTSLRNMIMNIYQNEGIKGFYKGYIPRILKKAASGALVWGVYENFKDKKEDK